MVKKKQKLVVVLGMHRSGTSVVTRGLKVMGVNLGESLLIPMQSVNAKGFWEDRDIYLLNVEMLAQFNREWFYLSSIESEHVAALNQKGYFLRAVELLKQKTSGIPIFGFKDPRMAKLLPFWIGVFKHLQFDVYYILVIRHPSSVAKSLAKRDGFPEQQSHLIWLGHVVASLTGSRDNKRIVVNFDALMESTEYELSRIAKFLNQEIDTQELQCYSDEFVAQNLRHSVYLPNDMHKDVSCPDIVRDIYTCLIDVAADSVKIDSITLDNKITLWSDEFDRLKSPLLLIDKLVYQKKSLTKDLSVRDEYISDLNKSLDKHENRYNSTQKRIAECEEEIANLKQKLSCITEDLGLQANQNKWVITKPLKFYYQCLLIRPGLFISRKLPFYQLRLTSYLPLSIQSWQNFISLLYSKFPRLYQIIQKNSSRTKFTVRSKEYIELFNGNPLKTKAAKIILVSHDAHPHGAQYLLLYLAKTLSSELGFKVDVVLLGDGALAADYSRWATVHILHGLDTQGKEARDLAQKLVSSGHSSAIVNTTVSGFFLKTLQVAGLRCVALIHELSGVIEANGLHEQALVIAKTADTVVFPTEQVAQSFNHIAHVSNKKLKIQPQGLYKRNAFIGKNDVARKQLRQSLKLEGTARVVLCVGYIDHRKGIDHFVEAGIKVAEIYTDVFFVWVGHWDLKIRSIIEQRINETQLQNRFIFVGRKDDTDLYYAGADIYALTSREDPFPSVVMESLQVAVPVVGFKESGGCDILLAQGCGLLVEKYNIAAYAKTLLKLLDYPEEARSLGQKGAAIIKQSFSFRHYLYTLLDFAKLSLKRVSVIIPNYNYAHYLEQRLESIVNQSYPVFEIIILDDASTDNSIDLIKKILANNPIDYHLIQNKQNSGSVFKQWQRGIDCARGDYIWICEADDDAADNFIQRTVGLFDDRHVVISYTQSKQIDENSIEIGTSYLHYTDDICRQKWLQDHIADGKEELATVQIIKNTIPNVSAVIFRKTILTKVMQECKNTLFKLRIAGDWLIYANMLTYGKVGYIADSLNTHRRHQSSVTASSSSNARHLAEIIFMQDYIAHLSTPNQITVKKANDYVEKIYKQFNLDRRFLHNPRGNSQVKQALSSISD